MPQGVAVIPPSAPKSKKVTTKKITKEITKTITKKITKVKKTFPKTRGRKKTKPGLPKGNSSRLAPSIRRRLSEWEKEPTPEADDDDDDVNLEGFYVELAS